MFLCSHCLTEQPEWMIRYEGLKECLCPNCGEICCQDYCKFFYNGRWNSEPGDIDISAEEEARYNEREAAAYAATKEAYELAHKQLDFLLSLRQRKAETSA